MQENGLTDIQLSLMFIILSVGTFVTQIPVTWITNKLGTKRAILLGLLLKACAFMLWFLNPTFWGFAIGMFLWGTEVAFYNVAFESMLYDELRARRHQKIYAKVLGIRYNLQAIGTALSAFGSLLMFAGYGWITFASLVSLAVAAMCIASINMRSSQNVKRKVRKTNFIKLMKTGGLYNAMSGSAFSQATVFAIGIQPYINASIIIELLAIAIPALERLAKEGGEEGQKKIQRITRYTTVGLALLMGFAYYVMLKNYNLLNETGFLAGLVIVMTFMAGASFLMWMGEQIDQFGIGNGISMILFAGIISRIPPLGSTLVSSLASGAIKWYTAILLVIGMLLIVVFIVFITNSERRVPVQYAKRVVGRKMYGGQSTFLPIKVNMSGVLPIIFAQSIATLPATIVAFTGTGSSSFWTWMNTYIFDTKSAFYIVCYFLLIIAFSYFYATIQFNPIEIANNLKKNGGFIPGFRPGKPTADFILKVINKITLFGALYLAIVAIMPILVGIIIGNSSLGIGGTSVIIVVGVALETVKALEAQMLMRHYKGFLE